MNPVWGSFPCTWGRYPLIPVLKLLILGQRSRQRQTWPAIRRSFFPFSADFRTLSSPLPPERLIIGSWCFRKLVNSLCLRSGACDGLLLRYNFSRRFNMFHLQRNCSQFSLTVVVHNHAKTLPVENVYWKVTWAHLSTFNSYCHNPYFISTL